jgi:hypothetical protein
MSKGECTFVRGKRYSTIAAMSEEGLLASRTVVGSATAVIFLEFLVTQVVSEHYFCSFGTYCPYTPCAITCLYSRRCHACRPSLAPTLSWCWTMHQSTVSGRSLLSWRPWGAWLSSCHRTALSSTRSRAFSRNTSNGSRQTATSSPCSPPPTPSAWRLAPSLGTTASHGLI